MTDQISKTEQAILGLSHGAQSPPVMALQSLPNPLSRRLAQWMSCTTVHEKNAAHGRVIALLRKRFARGGHEGRGQNQRFEATLARAFDEWADPHCTHCKGRGHVMREGVVSTCVHCNGTAIKRLSEHDRARALRMEVDTMRSWSERVDQVAAEINRAWAQVEPGLRLRLRRDA